ncbi:MAG: alpha/beta hydrolase [Oscillospiraceae bacterium]|nr:alpha/beta hydrolase [Oscillospiraceae bacterium]
MKYPIDRKERIELGGLKQTIHIWGSKQENPVILFLHGGPGIPNRHGMAVAHMDLLDDFTIVAWDQRGTGGSYFGCDPKTLTLDQLVSDCSELIDYLCDTLNKNKIFLLGGSWGTELGTFVCQKYPDKIAGYIGYGQVVNGIENENVSYAFALHKAKEANCAEDIDELERIGPPVDGQYKPVFEGLMAQRRIMKKYGGHSTKGGSYFTGTVIPILKSPELSLRDKIGTAKGYKVCLSQMWPTIVRYDFVKDCGPFRMPYYIFQGRLDNNTPSSLVQAYYDSIVAPDKDLVWFENSAHGPLGEEPVKFKKLMREKFLRIAKENAL